MKTKKSIVASADASLKTSRKKCRELLACLEDIEAGATIQDKMPKVRAVLSELTQRIHEFNAYNNAAETK